MGLTVRLTDERPKRVIGEGLFKPEEYAEMEKRRERLKAEAVSWLSARFRGVRPDEVGDRLAEAVGVITLWQHGCDRCTSTARCGHSRSVLDIAETYRRGFREFRVYAKPCERVRQGQEETE